MPGLGLWKETVESWIQGRQVSQGLQPLHNAFLLIHTTCRTTQKDETRQISRGLARYSASVITKKNMKLHSYFYLNVQHKTETKLKQSDVLWAHLISSVFDCCSSSLARVRVTFGSSEVFNIGYSNTCRLLLGLSHWYAPLFAPCVQRGGEKRTVRMLIDSPPGLTEQVAHESVQVCECGFIILQIKTDEKRCQAHWGWGV